MESSNELLCRIIHTQRIKHSDEHKPEINKMINSNGLSFTGRWFWESLNWWTWGTCVPMSRWLGMHFGYRSLVGQVIYVPASLTACLCGEVGTSCLRSRCMQIHVINVLSARMGYYPEQAIEGEYVLNFLVTFPHVPVDTYEQAWGPLTWC